MSTNSNLWIDKYKPTKISELVGNIVATNVIKSWVESFDKNRQQNRNNTEKKRSEKKAGPKSCLLITGNHGTGKTTTTEVILKELDYEIQYLNFSQMKNSSEPKKLIQTLLNAVNVINMMHNVKAKKFAVLIDEIESVTSTTEKKNILALQKDNDVNWNFPIIFVSNGKHNKLLSELKKSCLEVKFSPPVFSDLKKMLVRIITKEKMKIKDQQVVNDILTHSQSDIRRLIYTLQDLKYAYEDKEITVTDIQDYCALSKKKDEDISLFDATKKLLTSYTGMENCLLLYETEKVLLPLMVHENYYKNIYERKMTPEQTLKTLKNVSESLSLGDVIENHIYGDQNWDMQEIHGFHTCIATSYYLNSMKKASGYSGQLLFTTDLNKTSIKNINKKNIENVEEYFKDKSIQDYIYMNKILRHLISQNKITECANLLKDYGVGIEHIESLLKIDKIKTTTKNGLTPLQKRELQQELNI